MEADIVIFDVDGTLADASARQHHLKKKPKDWESFFQGIADDKAIAPMIKLCNILYQSGVTIILCTGRREQDRNTTEAWLQQQGVQYHELRLRRDGDRRHDTIVKREMLSGLDHNRILFVVEDRRSVVDMWRAEGLTCLQCAPGDF